MLRFAEELDQRANELNRKAAEQEASLSPSQLVPLVEAQVRQQQQQKGASDAAPDVEATKAKA